MNLNTSNKQKSAEKEHFDQWVDGKSSEVIFYDTDFLQSLLSDIENYAIRQFGCLKNKKILLYGCGVNLKPAIEFMNQGATIYMIDISPKSIDILHYKIKERGLQNNIFPVVMDCEALNFGSNEFDAVYGRAILHHLNLKKALDEIYRVLKLGGISVFIEPLGMNPLINLYRKLTPNRRTYDEKPFDKNDFKVLDNTRFSKCKHYEFNLFTNIGILLNGVLKFPKQLSPNYKKLKKMDDFVLDKLPLLRKFCWNTVLILTK